MCDTHGYVWAAGFFDGEGCVGLYNTGSNGNSRYPVIRVSQARREPLDYLQEMFGGTVVIQYRAKGKTYYSWQLVGSKAVAYALSHMLPFLRVKHKEAELLVEYCSRIGKCGTRGGLSEEERQARTAIYEEICRLKKEWE